MVAPRLPHQEKGREEASVKGSHRILVLIVLHVMLAIWSCTDVLSKYAAGEDFFSTGFFAMWAGVLVLMGVYALGWQQVIRRMPLATAFANKAITIVWGLFWGVALFGEAVTPGKIVGAMLVVAGIVLFVFSDAGEGKSRVPDEKDASSHALDEEDAGSRVCNEKDASSRIRGEKSAGPRTPSDEGDGA